jgi:hypothetical protein
MIKILDGLFWSFYYEYVAHNNRNRTKVLCNWMNNPKYYNKRIDSMGSAERSVETYLTLIEMSNF